MSMKTVIAIQIKRIHAKMMRMSQRTFRNGYDDAVISKRVRLQSSGLKRLSPFGARKDATRRLQSHHLEGMRALVWTTQSDRGGPSQLPWCGGLPHPLAKDTSLEWAGPRALKPRVRRAKWVSGRQRFL